MNENFCEDCKYCKRDRSLPTIWGLRKKASLAFARCMHPVATMYHNIAHKPNAEHQNYCYQVRKSEFCKWFEEKEKK